MDGLIQIDVFKDIAREIFSLEKERESLKEDKVQVKIELACFLPKQLVAKAIKIHLGKGMKEKDMDEYQQLCGLLDMAFPCQMYYVDKAEEQDEATKNRVKNIKRLLNNYENLQNEYNDYSVQIRDIYTQAKNKGISVPLLKKTIDFCLHPDKLEMFHENSPVLESYIELIPDIN